MISKTKKKIKTKTKYGSRYTNKNIKNIKHIKTKIIVSYFNDNTNIYHIFAKEIMAIWNESKGNLDTIIVLKNYVNNTINNWRLSLLKSVYKNVYIHLNLLVMYLNIFIQILARLRSTHCQQTKMKTEQ